MARVWGVPGQGNGSGWVRNVTKENNTKNPKLYTQQIQIFSKREVIFVRRKMRAARNICIFDEKLAWCEAARKLEQKLNVWSTVWE